MSNVNVENFSVLIVDSQGGFGEVFSKAFEVSGDKAFYVDQTTKAVEFLENTEPRPDVLVASYILSEDDMSAMGLIRYVKANYPTIHIVLMGEEGILKAISEEELTDNGVDELCPLPCKLLDLRGKFTKRALELT